MKIFFRWVSIIAFSLLIAVPVFAESSVEELTAKIAELQQQGNSLTKQINLLDSQVKLATAKIAETQKKITLLDDEIDLISGEITSLEALKTRRLELALHRIPVSYKRLVIPQYGQVLLGSNFSDFVERTTYMQFVQKQDSHLYNKIQLEQNVYSERKDYREKKKIEQETLRKQLEFETVDLARQKKNKQVLLTETQSSEVVYQRLLAQALAEKQALDRALAASVKVGSIKKGEPIALVGNTGYPSCSTGAHLHFEVRKGNSWVDPSQYLSNKTVSDQQNGGTWTVGSGSWSWPLSDTIQMTQHFGKTPYSWRYSYSGGIHTGYDMVSTGGTVIRAPADGELFASSQPCGNSVIKIKYIDHGDNLQSFYLHVQ